MPPAAPADVSALSESEPEVAPAVNKDIGALPAGGRGRGDGRGRGRGLGCKKAKVGIAETGNDGEAQPLLVASAPPAREPAASASLIGGEFASPHQAKAKGQPKAKAKAKAQAKATAKAKAKAKAKPKGEAKARARVQGATKAAAMLAAEVDVGERDERETSIPAVAPEEEMKSLEPTDSDGAQGLQRTVSARAKSNAAAKVKATNANAKEKTNGKATAKAKASSKKGDANDEATANKAASAEMTAPVVGDSTGVAGSSSEGAGGGYLVMRYISKNICAVRRKSGEQIISVGGINPKLQLESLVQICQDAIVELNKGKPLPDVKVMVASRKSALLAA